MTVTSLFKDLDERIANLKNIKLFFIFIYILGIFLKNRNLLDARDSKAGVSALKQVASPYGAHFTLRDPFDKAWKLDKAHMKFVNSIKKVLSI